MKRVHKERLRLWVEDLRTTDAKQTRGVLRREHGDTPGDCCLMRACVVYSRETGKGRWDGRGFNDGVGGWDDTGLPFGVMEWYGLEGVDPDIKVQGIPTATCQRLNDGYGWTFGEIADALEKSYGLAQP